MLISEWEILIRLGLAALLGMVVGYERERQNQPAGLRTHAILAIGSCLAMTVSINLSMQFDSVGANGDPARIAAQVVSGIGFLGAGAILRYGTNVKGLTTATSLWTIAIVGLAVGAGHYFSAAGTTVALLFVLVLLNILEKRAIQTFQTVSISVTAHENPQLAEMLSNVFKSMKKTVLSLGIEANLPHQDLTVTMVVKTRENDPLTDIRQAIEDIPGITHYRLN
ncbi:MAG TPA: MgtC/SapB family protein [Anaerolineaceae bacterium]|nr:MgtC/SapB family protein [Anaerolineaceae bacterium]HOV06357.1 MgtC/SapB family protein [Anaerolineaceae bacterium]